MDIASLESENLSYIRDLRKLRWAPMLELNDLIFECYTKLFYTNLNAQRNDNLLKAYLKGREVEITTSVLNHILGVLDQGELVTHQKEELGIEGYNSS